MISTTDAFSYPAGRGIAWHLRPNKTGSTGRRSDEDDAADGPSAKARSRTRSSDWAGRTRGSSRALLGNRRRVATKQRGQ